VAKAAGVPDYLRAPVVGVHPSFIAALADLVMRASESRTTISAEGVRLCPRKFGACPHRPV